MLTLIVGGSASGKSAFAENYAMEAGENRIYIATMQPMNVWHGLKNIVGCAHRKIFRLWNVIPV